MKKNYIIKLKCENCNFEGKYEKKDLERRKEQYQFDNSLSFIKTFFPCKNCGYEIIWFDPIVSIIKNEK